MEALLLIKPREEFTDEIQEFAEEFKQYGDQISGTFLLQSSGNVKQWIEFCRQCESAETLPRDYSKAMVEHDQYMLIREGDRKILGVIQFRHRLNEFLRDYGGHIGYSVRPTQRRKGYATSMLALCLEKCRAFGLDKVLITVEPENIGSKKTIIANHGIYEQTVHYSEGNIDLERYWIDLTV